MLYYFGKNSFDGANVGDFVRDLLGATYKIVDTTDNPDYYYVCTLISLAD